MTRPLVLGGWSALTRENIHRVSSCYAKVRSFVPLLVRRYVSDELQERIAHA